VTNVTKTIIERRMNLLQIGNVYQIAVKIFILMLKETVNLVQLTVKNVLKLVNVQHATQPGLTLIIKVAKLLVLKDILMMDQIVYYAQILLAKDVNPMTLSFAQNVEEKTSYT
jgi:hypothetical protein